MPRIKQILQPMRSTSIKEKENSAVIKSPVKNNGKVNLLKTVNKITDDDSSSDGSDSELEEVFASLRKKGIGINTYKKSPQSEKAINNSRKRARSPSSEEQNVQHKKPKSTSENTKQKRLLKSIKQVKDVPITNVTIHQSPQRRITLTLSRRSIDCSTLSTNKSSSPVVDKNEKSKLNEMESITNAVTPTRKSSRKSERAGSVEPKIEDCYYTPVKKSRLSLPVKCSTPETPKGRNRHIPRVMPSPRTPTTKLTKISVSTPKTPVEKARISLHVNAVPESLPCREKEFNNIYNFLENKLIEGIGGCMYISGVPGTGKTATVTQVVRMLQKNAKEDDDIPPFTYVELNGMRLTDPRQAYVQLYRSVFNNKERISVDNAQKKLLTWFHKKNSNKKPTVVLLDELDLMCTRKQDVVFNLLDWPSHANSRLIVISIANTMDMPEKKLKGRVTSRLGLTRVTFLPYTYKQLENIILGRLKECAGEDAFVNDAVRLAASKIAAVSGDARRALDICRRATELVTNPEDPVTVALIERAIREMTNTNVVQYIKSLSKLEKLFLRSLNDCAIRTGLDEVEFKVLSDHLESLFILEGFARSKIDSIIEACNKLVACRLVFSQNNFAGMMQRLTLNVSADDVHYALMVSDLE